LDSVFQKQGHLPDGYELVGNIEHIKGNYLSNEFQFISTFYATGEIYFNNDIPNDLCICITTYWLKDTYVIFSAE